ncbi:serine/threonine protein kinase/TGF-beta stimulated factor [Xylaria bambusicola]|uniref:serine/threonine protein kinase/TGF-beta stimulated factor n=1 Tax=Xylaria bambusicola TaxID=326684 RepID=UPI0020086BFF|nr:serine/threonine protein kinase/TGF-beta stimulated factor [Xylaria bambusicola]KAI0508372.1 serine/threonine protein kinase/TGF-beta stimulated factor [Xylaria bambusicola]
MAQLLQDLIYSFGNCLNCFPGSPTLKINSRSFKILRLLGEGGFSYVYLVQDTATAELFALKKIRCPFGTESVQQAMREVEAYKTFAHTPSIIHSIDYSIASERNDAESKTVYVLLPYYRRGNLQDIINANLVNHTNFPEKELMRLFLGVCKAMKFMHQYRAPRGGERMEMGNTKAGEEDQNGGAKRNRASAAADADDETEQARPLMVEEQVVAPGEQRSWAHRDIKPGNIMIDDSGSQPIIMDLGSIAESPIAITSRSLAIATQDTAAEHSTMPYRAPELFDVKTGTVIDTKVDIWSLGCTLYACLVGKSPFEMRSDETGGTLSMCVLGGDWRFPDEGPQRNKKGKNTASANSGSESGVISEPIKEVVRKCLKIEPSERPDIDELITMTEEVISELPDDEV